MSFGTRYPFKDLSIFRMAAFNKGSRPWAGFWASGCLSLRLYYNLAHHSTLFAERDVGILILVKYNGLSMHTGQVVHHAGAYPGFSSIERRGIFYSPLDGMLARPSKGYPQH